ncbi:MAG: hypothetical protein V4662_22655 [Verrucomicrobiota bacterium]
MKPRASQFILWLGLLASPALAQKTLTNGAISTDGRLTLEMRSVFDPMPPSGYAPLRIVATNAGDGDTRWDFSFVSQTRMYRQEGEHRSQFSLPVPAHSTQSATFLAPLTVKYGDASSGYWNNNHEFLIAVEAGGSSFKKSDFHERADDFPAIAISKGLADANHSKLKDEVEKRTGRSGSSKSFFGSTFAPADLPEDWRGLSGFDFLMITGSEWQTLKPGQQLAVLQWVRFYGRLHVYNSNIGATPAGLGLPEGFEANKKEHSMGKIELITWDGSSLNASETVSRYYRGSGVLPSRPSPPSSAEAAYDQDTGNRTKELTAEYANRASGPASSPTWGLLNALGERSFASWQVIVFLVIFGILVGPVNLFVLAPSGRRHRLFITTPVLSVGASVLMVVVILMQDGVGGAGARLVVIDVEPEEALAYVTQEQASRTGVLMGGGFELKQPALIEPLALPDSPWVKLKNNSATQPAQLAQNGSSRSGNYFQSRAEQGQILRAAVSTRGRLELKSGLAADAAPEVISALGFTLSELFYIDGSGMVWRSSGAVATGRQVKLFASDAATLRGSLYEFAELSDGAQRSGLSRLMNGRLPRNTFLASAKAAPGFTQDTLSSIRWQEDKVLVFGPLKQP